jgi:uncharacterized integral membrane protein (TIGR00698 family)
MMTLRQRLSSAAAETVRSGSGLALCILLGAFAAGLAGAIPIWGGSGVVYALLVGMLLAALWSPPAVCAAGIDAAAKPVLRVGVALLGTQISAQTLATVDLATIALLAASIIVILIAGALLARVLGIARELALVAAASVAICGASAAVAFALVLARAETRERDAACTVGAVSVLSTAAMLLYPPLAHVLGLDPVATGIFLGATIQEVPHAVAAGYGVDADVGNIATTTKLLRVALLGPALILVSAAVAGSAASNRVRTPYGFLPPFLITFFAFAALNVAGMLPRIIVDAAGPLSRFLLVIAMAAIGLKLPWRSIAGYGWRPLLLLALLSALLVAMVAIYLLG